MVAQVYASPEVGCLVVELTRRAGDAFKFKELREDLAKELGSIVSSAADVVAMASKYVMTFCALAHDGRCVTDPPGLWLWAKSLTIHSLP